MCTEPPLVFICGRRHNPVYWVGCDYPQVASEVGWLYGYAVYLWWSVAQWKACILCTAYTLCTLPADSSDVRYTTAGGMLYDYACFPQSSFTGTTWQAGTVRDPTCLSSSCYFLPTPQPHWALSLRGPFCNGMSTHRTPTMASTLSEPAPVTVQQNQLQLKSLCQCALQHSACSNSSSCSSAVLTTVLESCDNWTVPLKGVLGGGHGSER